MKLDIVKGSNDKPVASEMLIESVTSIAGLSGQLWVGFPLLGGLDGSYPVDAILLSPKYGAVAIDLVEGLELGDYTNRQDDTVRLLQSRLLQHRELVRKKRLAVEVQSLTFAPAISDGVIQSMRQDDYPLANSRSLASQLDELTEIEDDDRLFEQMLSSVQNLSTLRKARTPRVLTRDDSLGSKLKQLEGSIATLDRRQSAAVIEAVDGVQRIRGLAGSGKTIVLALKAAYLHAYHPEWTIAVTFNARSLREQFTRLIRNFYMDQSGEEPNWEKLRIINSWGSRGATPTGIYAQFCQTNSTTFYDFGTANRMFADAFGGACENALAEAKSTTPAFDAILVDEAQDFPPSFLRLCYALLDEKKRLVYAYDELQSLSGIGMASTTEIFGLDTQGRALVDFEPQDENDEMHNDIVLDTCYRNSRPVLVTAHALGFGIFREPNPETGTGLVQMFDQAPLWHDIGYRTDAGQIAPGHHVVLKRTDKSSPKFLEQHSTFDELIQFRTFASSEEQDEWVAAEIKRNIETDELRHDDIMVVNPTPLTARQNLGPLRAKLLDVGVHTHLAGVDTSQDVFFQRESDSVTFTGIYRAKGNEAGMVYVVNAQEGESSRANLSVARNRLFTAITRSKAWVRVVGVGEEMDALKDEFEKARAAHFKLDFIYPTAEQRERLRIVHREVSPTEESDIASQNESAKGLIERLKSGQLYTADLDPGVIEELRELLKDPDA
jgi:superfamily I DNA and RNA helicase